MRQMNSAPVRVQNAVVVGGVTHGIDAHGVYDADGRFVENSAIYQGDRCRSGAAPSSLLHSDMPRLDGSYVYGGYAAGHFGHILVESFARMHLFLDQPAPIVFAEMNYRKSALFRQIITTLGLPQDRVIILDRPTRIEELQVFAPDLSIRNYALPRYAQALEAVGNTFCTARGITQNSDPRPLYISRSRTNQKGRYYFGEATLERFLEAAGYRIAYPETLPLDAQFRLLLEHRNIAGFYGSALHPLVFSRAPKTISYLACEPINATFSLIESVKHNDWSVVHVDARASGKANQPKLLSREGIAQICDALKLPCHWPAEIRQHHDAATRAFEETLSSLDMAS